jgi:hypothetical protein
LKDRNSLNFEENSELQIRSKLEKGKMRKLMAPWEEETSVEMGKKLMKRKDLTTEEQTRQFKQYCAILEESIEEWADFWYSPEALREQDERLEQKARAMTEIFIENNPLLKEGLERKQVLEIAHGFRNSLKEDGVMLPATWGQQYTPWQRKRIAQVEETFMLLENLNFLKTHKPSEFFALLREAIPSEIQLRDFPQNLAGYFRKLLAWIIKLEANEE